MWDKARRDSRGVDGCHRGETKGLPQAAHLLLMKNTNAFNKWVFIDDRSDFETRIDFLIQTGCVLRITPWTAPHCHSEHLLSPAGPQLDLSILTLSGGSGLLV